MMAQVALSLLLLVSTALFVHTLQNLHAADPGFDTARLLLFRIDAASAGYPRAQFGALDADVQRRLERIPGVESATYARVPLLAGVRSNRKITIAGYTPEPGDSMIVNLNGVAPGFFTSMKIPLLTGRGFDLGDEASAAPVVVVNEAFSRKFFGGDSPVGRTLRFTGVGPLAKPTDLQIVGLARNAR
jgi:hypothetical protein